MKYFFFILFMYFLLLDGNAQEKTRKPDIKSFEDSKDYDSLDILIISDKTDLSFIYSDSYLGAVDESFKLELSRHIRFKINDTNSIFKNGLNFFYNDSISKPNFKKIDVYTMKNGKVVKKDFELNPSLVKNDNSNITIDLSSLEIPNNCILYIKYSARELTKTKQILKLKYPYFIIASSLNISIPEIYFYEIIKHDKDSLIDKYSSNTVMGIFIGYHMPEVNLENKLVGPAYYKILKNRGEDVSKAEKIYCKYIKHHYYSENVIPNANSKENNTYIELRLKSINPILY